MNDSENCEKKNARRGYIPDDEKWFSSEGIKTLEKAARNILYLLNEGYDMEKAAVFVGNHFLLSARQRTALMRMVCSDEDLKNRIGKRILQIKGKEVWIDGFNQIITLETYLQNGTLIQGFDGCIKDLAGLRGSYHLIPETRKACDLLLLELKEKQANAIQILLDRNVSNSGRLLTMIAEEGEKLQVPVHVHMEDQVDQKLKTMPLCITTDSIILNQGKHWYNLLRNVIPEEDVRFCLTIDECR